MLIKGYTLIKQAHRTNQFKNTIKAGVCKNRKIHRTKQQYPSTKIQNSTKF
jgi:hypothetical protein